MEWVAYVFMLLKMSRIKPRSKGGGDPPIALPSVLPPLCMGLLLYKSVLGPPTGRNCGAALVQRENVSESFCSLRQINVATGV